MKQQQLTAFEGLPGTRSAYAYQLHELLSRTWARHRITSFWCFPLQEVRAALSFDGKALRPMFGGNLSNFDLSQVLPKALAHREQSRRTSLSSDSEDEQEAEYDGYAAEAVAEAAAPVQCKICGSTTHKAGFVGAHYIDCCDKACYLCKKEGHTTLECAHRVRLSTFASLTEPSEYTRRQRLQAAAQATAFARVLHNRAATGRQLRPWSYRQLPPPADRAAASGANGQWQMSSQLRVHSRRVTALMFHLLNSSTVVSGDGAGEISAYNWRAAAAAAIGTAVDDSDAPNVQILAPAAVAAHTAQVNGIAVLPNSDAILSCALDGIVKSTDLDSESSATLLQLNPDSSSFVSESQWQAFHSMTVTHNGAVLSGDNKG
jgi:DNA damage-binding protein 2